MAGIMKKIMPVSKSMSGNEFIDFDPDISIAIEYTGSPINHSFLPKVLPVDIDRIPTAKVAVSPALLYNLSLPVVEPVVRESIRASKEVILRSKVKDLKIQETPLEHRLVDANDHVCFDDFEEIKGFKGFVEKKDGGVFSGNLDGGIESSGTLGFSDSTRDHSHEFSESSDMLETPVDCNEIECFQDYMNPDNYNLAEPGSTPQVFSGVICYEEEEASDGEHLECRRSKKPAVTFCDQEFDDMVGEEDSEEGGDGRVRERPVPQRPAKRGLCYRCHRGNRFTEKEACLVCDAKYCSGCILRAMGSMPEGRKCLTCIGFPVDESKRPMLGKCSRVLKGLLKDEEVKQIMNVEVSSAANQLPPECIYVNGSPLCMEELLELRSCSNPPKNLNPGNYWYDKVSGFWGKEGHKPCQIITPQLNVGHPKLKRDASDGNENVFLNGREVTKAELWMLQSAGVQCAGSPNFWLQADGTYQEEGMNLVKGKIWGRKRTKVLCTLLSLPTPESPNPSGKSNLANEGGVPIYLERRAFCKILLVGNVRSGTSTFYKQARVLFDIHFSEEERLSIKSMIQSNLYGYLASVLEGRERFEEESLLRKRKGKSTDQPGPSDSKSDIQAMTDYTIGSKLKGFSDWLINIMVSGNMDIIFPAATREYAPHVEELWKDPAFQATYSRRDELELPRVASYFLDRAVEIAQVDYEPSDTDILYAEGITSSNGLRSMEFSFPQNKNEYFKDADEPDPVRRYQLIRVPAKSLGKNCKWLEMFEDVGIVLFCVSLTEYDEYEVDRNGEVKNKMLQSRALFESIVTHPGFEETNFLLILNKFDLLEEMIEQVPLTHCDWFEDFNPVFSRQQSSRRSGNTIAPLAQRAFHYIAVKFKTLFKSLTGRKLYVCPVTGLESDTVDSTLRYASEIVKWEDDKLSFSLNESSSESIENSSSYNNTDNNYAQSQNNQGRLYELN